MGTTGFTKGSGRTGPIPIFVVNHPFMTRKSFPCWIYPLPPVPPGEPAVRKELGKRGWGIPAAEQWHQLPVSRNKKDAVMKALK